MGARGNYAKGAARREQILETAMRVLGEEGYHGTSVRGIARALGLEPAHVLYYFGTREQLMRDVVERWDALSQQAVSVPGADGIEQFASAVRRNLSIRGVVHLYLAFATESVPEDHPGHEFIRDRFAGTSTMLARTLIRGQQQGLVRRDIDSEKAARMLVALADGLQLQSLVDPSVDAPGDLDAFIDQLFISGRQHRIRDT